jgi:DNA polymerase III subunit delta'
MNFPKKTNLEIAALAPVKESILADFQGNKPKNSYLISGASFVGKAETAWQIARSVVDEKYWDLDICVLDAEYSKIGIKDLRQMQEMLSRSAHGEYKFCIIRAIECLSIPAINSLLKVLEDTKQKLCFILTSNNSQLVLDTIKSRCQSFNVSNCVADLDIDLSGHELESKVFFGKNALALHYIEDEGFRADFESFWQQWELFFESGSDKLFKGFLADQDRKALALYLELISLWCGQHKQELGLENFAFASRECLSVRKLIRQNSNQKLALEVLSLKLNQVCG